MNYFQIFLKITDDAESKEAQKQQNHQRGELEQNGVEVTAELKTKKGVRMKDGKAQGLVI